MSWMQPILAATVVTVLAAGPADAAFILEIDTDTLDNGSITFNPLFSFGGDTTTAATSVASSAFGLAGGDSIFGGDGVAFPDTYVYMHDPSLQADNLVLAPGQPLGNGNFATGAVGGAAGLYNVYATWPFTINVGGGNTQYTIETMGVLPVVTSVDQNGGGAGAGDAWYLIGQIQYSNGNITVTQTSTLNSFVSMRAAGLLFEAEGPAVIPEPSFIVLIGIGLAGRLLYRGRRRGP